MMTAPKLSKTRILCVDDSKSILAVLSSLFTMMQYEMVGLLHPEEAYESCKDSPPFDLIISDYNMPGMNGLELVSKIRQLPQYTTTPILLLTTEDTQALRAQAIDLAVTEWVTKPFNVSQMKELVEKHLDLATL